MGKAAPPIADTIAPPTNFKLSVEERLQAYVQGVPGYIRRRRQIEDLEKRLLGMLVESADAAASAEFVAGLARLNELIGRHNRYYPIEANLPIDLKTGRLVERGTPWRPLPALTAAELRARAAASPF